VFVCGSPGRYPALPADRKLPQNAKANRTVVEPVDIAYQESGENREL